MPPPPAGQAALITALNVVSASVSVADDVSEVLAQVVEAARRFTGTEKVVLALVDETTGELGLDDGDLVVRGCRDEHVQAWWGERLPAIAADVSDDGRPYFEADDAQKAWILAVPVRVRDRPLGVLLAINSVRHRLRQEHTAFLSILGAVAASAIANARLAEESRFALLASERERIAREMHDGIAQSLFSISLGLDLCRKQVGRDPAGVARRLEELEDLLRASMGELRRYIYDLHPARLQELGLIGAIEYWIRESVPPTGPRVRVEERGRRIRLTTETESCLYRVARESVSNAVRHAHAGLLDVLVCYEPTEVTLVVADDGHGFDVREAMYDSNAGSSVGLRSIAERVESAGGRLSIDSRPGSGCRVRVSVPLEEVVR